MDVAEINSGVQKSSTSMAESSQEVSVEKTATGVIEQAVSSQRKVEQSVEQSVKQESSSTQVVQKSVQSSVSDEKPTVKEEEIEDKEAVSSPPKENGEAAPTPVKKVEFSDKRDEVKLEDIGENDEDEEEEVEEEIIEVEGSESGEEVEVVETVVLKKETKKTTQPEVVKEEKQIVEETIVLPSKPKPVEVEASTPDKGKEEIKEEIEEEQTVQVTIKPKPPTAKQQEQEVVKDEETEVKQQPQEEPKPQVVVQEQQPKKQQEQPQPEIQSQPEIQPQPQIQSQPQIRPEPQEVKPQPIYQHQHVAQQDRQQQIPEYMQPTPQIQPKLQQTYQQQQPYQPQNEIKQEEESSRIVSKSTTQEQTSDGTGYTTTSQLYERSEFKESAAKNVDLQKIFTPATDASELLPKNRKLYASSAFYSPSLHPTVEDQVELARRISHSLSDISNQQSKGQSMYVNRKKRSVKWEHEGEGRAAIQEYNGYTEELKENGYTSRTSSSSVHHDKVPLKLVMNPRGQIRDFSSMRHEDFNTEVGLLSPDKCAELVTALHAPTGKGAELFAKRRKKSEKWIVDESNAATQSPGGGYAYGPLKSTSPIVPAYSDVGVQRVQLNMHQDQVQDKYAQPRLKLIKTPWEAALETGNASSAFQEISSGKGRPAGFPGSGGSYDYTSQQNFSTSSYYQPEPTYESQPQKSFPRQSYGSPSSQRELAYKPSVPQGWNAPPPSLPSALYVPPQIPLDSYVPPSTEKYLPQGIRTSSSSYQTTSNYQSSSYQQPIYQSPTSFPTYQPAAPQAQPQSFPVSPQPKVSAYSYSAAPPKQTTTQWVSHQGPKATGPTTAFDPSPLPYEKLAKFEQPNPDDPYATSYSPPRRLAPPSQSRVRNVSPTPFMSSSLTSKPSYPAPRSAPAAPTISPQIQPTQQHFPTATSNYYTPSDDSYSYGSVPSSRVSVDMSQCQNYNTAARGWNQMRDYYRPITFSKPRAELPYTDF